MENTKTQTLQCRKGKVFADATVDFTFKRIFASPENKDATISFLNSILPPERRIGDITFLNNEDYGDTMEGRRCVFDVLCRASDGSTFNLEMQNLTHSYFRERMVLYGSRLVSRIAERNSYKLPPSYVIAILAGKLTYDYGDEPYPDGKYLSHYVLREEQLGIVLPGNPEYYFIELGRFGKKVGEPMADNVEKWLHLLRDSSSFPEVPEEYRGDAGFDAFFRGARVADFSNNEYDKYINDMTTKLDIEIARKEEKERLERALREIEKSREEGRQEGERKGREEGERKGRQEGREEGRQEGREEGREEGRQEGRQEGERKGRVEGLTDGKKEIAVRLKGLNFGIEEIVKITGLPVETVGAMFS